MLCAKPNETPNAYPYTTESEKPAHVPRIWYKLPTGRPAKRCVFLWAARMCTLMSKIGMVAENEDPSTNVESGVNSIYWLAFKLCTTQLILYIIQTAGYPVEAIFLNYLLRA